jgi:hypothetical protein
MAGLRTITYKRHEFHGEPEQRSASLLSFVYDILYFGACGVFPPLHVINQTFSTGGGDGGMSPGATWEPFTVSEEEYGALVHTVRTTPASAIQPHARYAWCQLTFDHSFDHIGDRFEWMRAVCNKHHNAWRAALKAAGYPGETPKD